MDSDDRNHPHRQRHAGHARACRPRQHLIDFLRETLGLTGSHVGCEHGVCGACTVRVDGEIVRGCLMLAVQANGRKVDTIEGLSDSGELAELQKAFHEHNALQCGFCTPGMLLAAQDLVRTKPDATRDEIREHMSGNYCRCTGYQAIVDAIEEVPMAKSAGAQAELPLHAPGTQVDQRLHRPERAARRTRSACCRAAAPIVDDLRFPRLAHVVFFRSPYAHAQDQEARLRRRRARHARRDRGLRRHARSREYCTPWVAVLAHLKGIKSPPQYAIAIERACWQGEAVAAVVAETRAQAEDALALIEAEWEELPAVTDMEESLAGQLRHPPRSRRQHLLHARRSTRAASTTAFAKADVVVEETYDFGRHTGVCLETRSILADYNAAEHSLTVYHSTQAPHMMQDIFSRHLGIPEANVRVIAKDVGGSFGIKVHVYPGRDGDRRAVGHAAPAGEVRRRPAGVVR